MTSKTTVLAVVVFIGLIALALIAGAVVLIALDKGVPDPLWTLAGGALGGLTALLASTRSTLSDKDVEPTLVAGMVPIAPVALAPVVVENAPSGPVAVVAGDAPV